MPKALIVQLADDVVAQLNAKQGGWSVGFKAERKYQPKKELEQTDTLQVQVAIAAWRMSPDNRTDWAHEIEVQIGLMYRANPSAGDQAKEKFDGVLLLAQQIAEYWAETRPDAADCPLHPDKPIAFGVGGDQPYIAEHIEKFNQLTTVVSLTYWKLREPGE